MVIANLSRTLTRFILGKLELAPPAPLSIRDRQVSLYIHVPFCRRLCKFCHFVRYPFNEALAREYFAKLKRDVEELYRKGVNVKELYVGGGSPSCLPEELGELIDEIWARWKPLISVEVAPADVIELNALEHLDPAKVKRVSMGIQSLRPERLKRLGRSVDLETSMRALDELLARNYDVVNADFIWDVDTEISEIEEMAELGVPQLTLYPLMPPLSEGSELERFRLYKEIANIMKERGYARTNAWTFSKGSSELYDEYVSKDLEFVGIGVSAISLYDGRLAINTFSIEKYLKSNNIVHEHSLKLNPFLRRAVKGAYTLHSSVTKIEALNYAALVVLREAYSVLGEYRIRKRERDVVRGVGFEPTQAYASGS